MTFFTGVGCVTLTAPGVREAAHMLDTQGKGRGTTVHDTHRFASLHSLLALLAGLFLFSCDTCGTGGDGANRPDGGVGDFCTTNTECGAAFICAGGACQLEGSVGLGGNCAANRDCTTDLFCTPFGACGPAGGGGVGAACATGAECDKGLFCELFGFGGTCEEGGAGDLGQACSSARDCLPGLACAADGACKAATDAFPPFTGADCPADDGGFRVYFEVPRAGAPPADFFRLPFPNDSRVDASTGAVTLDDFPRPGPSVLGVDLIDLYVDALQADFRGWSSVATVHFRTSAALEFDSLGGGANVHYIDITPSTPEYGKDRARSFSTTAGRGLYMCDNSFTIANEPHQPLLPNHTYAVYLSDAIRSADMDSPSQDADFAAVLSSTRPSGDPGLSNAWDQHQLFRDYLGDQSINPASIAGAAVFTVADYIEPTQALQAAVQATTVPELKNLTLCDSGVTSPCDDGATRACGPADLDFYEVHGRYTVPIYQAGTPPYATPADGGAIVFENGVPKQVGTDDVCMVMLIPKTTKPASGWPLAVYGHGTGGSFKGVVGNGIGRELAKAGIAVFSWDGVVHGERRANHPRDENSLMFNIINPAAALYNNLQGSVDVMQAFRLGGASAATLGGVPGTIDFDSGNIFYFGHSQGSNVGVPAIAVAPEPHAVVLSGAGAFLTQGILNKTSPTSSKEGLELLIGEPLSASHPVMTIWQTYFDPSDTVNFGPLILNRPPGGGVTATHVLQTWADDDTFAPRRTLNIMAASMQVNLGDPVLAQINAVAPTTRPIAGNKATPDGNRTAVVLQYLSAADYDGHFVAQRNPNAIADWLEFLTTAIDGVPTISVRP